MPKFRFTVRRLMIFVTGAAVLLWLCIAGMQVAREPDIGSIAHLRQYRDNGELFVYGHVAPPSAYWSKYWRKVLGLSWPGNYVCPCKEEQERELGRQLVDLETTNNMNPLHDRMSQLYELREEGQAPQSGGATSAQIDSAEISEPQLIRPAPGAPDYANITLRRGPRRSDAAGTKPNP